VCTECFLQVKKPNSTSICPFCNAEDYNVIYTGPKTKEEIDKDETEQRKVSELQLKMRQDEEERDRLKLEQRKLASESPKPDIRTDTVEILQNTNNSEISSNDWDEDDFDDDRIRQAIQLSMLEFNQHQQQLLNRQQQFSEVQ